MSEITNINLLKFVRDCTFLYGKEVVESRALPDYRDGLKPVHRRVLWTMYKLNLKYNSGYKKSARVVGDCIGKYHPHGDMSCYSTMVNMALSPEKLIDGQGNWGDYEGEGVTKGAAASRYTECRLTKYSDTFLLDPDYIAVTPMISNYDGEYIEPVILPAKLPNLLINGSEGIAVGCISNVPSFTQQSITELVKIALLKKITPNDCLNLKFNFSWGGNNCNSNKELKEFYKTGKGKLSFIPEYTLKNNILTISHA